MIDRALGDPRGFSARRTTAIEAGGTAFRFGAIGEFADGSPVAPAEDAGGEIPTGVAYAVSP